MNMTSFEHLHIAEARRAEWRMLDTALQERTAGVLPAGYGVRLAIGRSMIRLGTRLTGAPPASRTDADDWTPSYTR